MGSATDFRIVAAIDFGTTYSGFAFAHKDSPEDIEVQPFEGGFKTPTALKYDKDFKKVLEWGIPAVTGQEIRKNDKPVELFKLYLGEIDNDQKPYLPEKLNYKQAIRDYLQNIGDMLKEKLKKTYKFMEFYDQVLIILTVPAEFNNNAISIMRECAWKAGLTDSKNSRNLKFTTEPEAAAIHCMNFLNDNGVKSEDLFMVVDCGGGTVDLTTRQLLFDNALGEITERTGDFCGSIYIDKEFVKFLKEQIDETAVEEFMKKHYGQMRRLIQYFCKRFKIPFTGNEEEFENPDLDIRDFCPDLEDYCSKEVCEKMEEKDWMIELTCGDVKVMFDVIIKKILDLIRDQLNGVDCSAILLVGGFAESEYLQKKIKSEFQDKVKNISVPKHPITAVVKGAVKFGINEHIITNRVLKWTYGTDIARKWEPDDPLSRKLTCGMVKAFHPLAKKGSHLTNKDKVTQIFRPYSLFQKTVSFNIYNTSKLDVKYCDEDEVEELYPWEIEVPISEDYEDQIILLTMNFGSIEILAKAENQKTGQEYKVTFKSG